MAVQPQSPPVPDAPPPPDLQPPHSQPVQTEMNYAAPPPPPEGNPPAPVWFQRMSLFILVIFCIYVGVAVAVLPWIRTFWDFNVFFLHHPQLWAIMRLGPVRGVISGVGLLDIWIGVSEAIHYRDQRS